MIIKCNKGMRIDHAALFCRDLEQMRQFFIDYFDARSLERTAVVKITLTAPPTGKRKQYDKQGEEMKYGRME